MFQITIIISATHLIKNLQWLTVSNMINTETATVTYNAITGLVPSYSNLFTRNSGCNISINLRNTTPDLYTKDESMHTSKSDVFSWC